MITSVNSNLGDKNNRIIGYPFNIQDVTINSKSVYTFAITPTLASDEHILFAYIKQTGWAGIIPQSMEITIDFKSAVFTIYNSTDSDRTVTISGVYWAQSSQK